MVNTITVNAVTKRQRRPGVTPEVLSRVRDWIEREVTYIANPTFADRDVEAQLQRQRPPSLDAAGQPARQHPGAAFVTGLADAPLLTRNEEVYLFTWMNYLRYRADQVRQRLTLNSPDPALIDRIESDLRAATDVRNRIVRSNLRLVVALARKFSGSLDQMSELIGEASIPLIRAVELFDVGLGNRFSTYATWAVRNHLLRRLKRQHSAQDRAVGWDDLSLLHLPDDRVNPDEEARLAAQRSDVVQHLLTSLSERERLVISARFGLDGQPHGQSLNVIAGQLGLSKERVRQIALNAIKKLQGAAATCHDADLVVEAVS